MKATTLCACAVIGVSLPAAATAQNVRLEGEAGAGILMSAAQRAYETAKAGARLPAVTLNSSASALAKLCRGEVGAAGTLRQATAAEKAACAQSKLALVELPVATDAATLIVNPGNGWAKEVSMADLRRIWLEAPAKPARWNEVNNGWPEAPLKLYGPTAGMGLSTTLRAALAGGGEAQPLRRDISVTEVLSTVVEGVARDRAGFGLVDRATYAANAKRVRHVPIAGGAGVAEFTVYVYASSKSLEDAGLRAYLEHLVSQGPRLATAAGLGALDGAAYEEARKRLSVQR